MNDSQLLSEYRGRRSQAAFTQIMERHYGLVLGLCLRDLGDRPMAEDAAQVVFLLLSRKAGSIRVRETLAGWLFQTARWVCKDMKKQEYRRRERERGAFENRPVDVANDRWSDIEPYINDDLAGLSAADREAVLLRFFKGMSVAETGAALGVTESAAKMRISRALAKLRTFVLRHGVQLELIAIAELLTQHAKAAELPTAHVPAPSTHAIELTQRMIKQMALTKVKIAAAVVLLGAGAAVGVSKTTHHAAPAPEVIVLPDISAIMNARPHIAPKPSTGKGILIGRAVYENGKPAVGLHVGAQMQNQSLSSLKPSQYPATGAAAVTDSHGNYKLAGLINRPYNVTIQRPDNSQWVTRAAEHVTANEGGIVRVPDLIVGKGTFITGMVFDSNTGLPLGNAEVMSYGPTTPESTAMVITAMTDKTGHYRLRVEPGESRVYAGTHQDENDRLYVPETGATVNLRMDGVQAYIAQGVAAIKAAQSHGK